MRILQVCLPLLEDTLVHQSKTTAGEASVSCCMPVRTSQRVKPYNPNSNPWHHRYANSASIGLTDTASWEQRFTLINTTVVTLITSWAASPPMKAFTGARSPLAVNDRFRTAASSSSSSCAVAFRSFTMSSKASASDCIGRITPRSQ